MSVALIGKRTWFQRPLTALSVLAAVTIFSIYVIFASDGRLEGGEEAGFTVTLRHYGNDADEMETSVAIPLEDALAAIPGISRIVTSSENGQVRTFVNFRLNRRGLFTDRDDYYEAVREAAQRVYETLPSSAQRPEFSSSGDSRIPSWIAAIYGSPKGGVSGEGGSASPEGFQDAPLDGDILERVVKPALGAIEGVGEVEIAGTGIKEIVILLDKEKAAALNLSPGKLSAVLASNDMVFSGGFFNNDELEIPFRVDGRYPDLESLEEALVPLDAEETSSGGIVRLKDIAEIRERDREADTISRLNGKKTVVVSVTAASGTDHGVLSKRIKKEIERLSHLPLEWRILEDRGAEEAKAFRSVLIAAFGASVLVAAAAVILGAGKPSFSTGGLVCAGAVPLISVISAALLALAGFPVDRKFLAGLAVGIGGAVDAVILSAEGFGRVKDPSGGKSALKDIWRPLISGAATTAAALLPLAGFSASGDITVIACALGTVTLVSVLLALTLLPPLFFWANTSNAGKIFHFSYPEYIRVAAIPARRFTKNNRRRFFRFFAALSGFSQTRPFVFPAAALVVSTAAFLALLVSGSDTAGEWSEGSVYFQAEFDGGFLKDESDLLLADWAERVKNHPAVRAVQTGARTGSGYGLVTFDPRKIKNGEIRDFIRAENIPGAFIYIPEASSGDRIWTVTVSGDDSEKCRELAEEAAALCSGDELSLFVKETVLNFKRGGPRLTLRPRRELLANGGITFSSAADTIRRGVHGPVAYKRNNGGETDVRIQFSPRTDYTRLIENTPAHIPPRQNGNADSGRVLTGDDVLRIPLTSGAGSESVRVTSVMEAEKTHDFSGIRRENRRRTASFSIRTDPGDPRFYRGKVTKLFMDIDLPPGYKIEFDPDAVREAESLSGKFFNFIWAVLFCYMVIAAAEESFALPLIIISSVPFSLAVPVLLFILFGIPVNAVTACALVAVSGMTVNASVISAGELWRHGCGNVISVYRGLRNRVPALAATAGTTVAGSLPFLFLREGTNAFVRTLALVTVIGVGISFVCAFTLIPSLMNLYFRIRAGRLICKKEL